MTDVLAGRIIHPRSDGVVYGPGVAKAELAALVVRVGGSRPYLVTTPSLERSGLAATVASWLGDGLAGTFAGSREHTPAPVVIEGAQAARDSGADCVVSLGGSSVVDLTKGIALLMAEGGEFGGPSHGRRPSPARARCAQGAPHRRAHDAFRRRVHRRSPASPTPTSVRSRCTPTPS